MEVEISVKFLLRGCRRAIPRVGFLSVWLETIAARQIRVSQFIISMLFVCNSHLRSVGNDLASDLFSSVLEIWAISADCGDVSPRLLNIESDRRQEALPQSKKICPKPLAPGYTQCTLN